MSIDRLTAALRPAAAVALLCVAALPAGAQTAPPPPLRVFLDCQGCDFDHLRTEVSAVDYVRDRQDADVHVLVTRQSTGAGGTEHAFHFLGLRELAGHADTLFYVSRQDETDAERRSGIARTFGLGLVRFMAMSGRGADVELGFRRAEPPEGTAAAPLEDPWNLWVFRAQVGGEVEGESRQSAQSLNGSFSASRTTEDFKVNVSVRGEYERDEFELSDGGKLVSSARDIGSEATAVWSLGPHWSWGFSGSAGAATSVNQRLGIRVAPALEYSFYPYADATRRQITALYRVGIASFRYEEPTLFEKLRETRPEQSLELAADFTQPWGELFVSLTGSHYLDDPSQHRVELFTNFEVRLLRGLSLDIRGSVARIKDQIYVPLEETSDEDILLRRRELGTDFEYSVDVGLSFTFGSVFNNVVNPRIFSGGNNEWR